VASSLSIATGCAGAMRRGLWPAQDAPQSLEAVGREGGLPAYDGEEAEPKTVMIEATYLKAYRTASSLRVKKRVLGAKALWAFWPTIAVGALGRQALKAPFPHVQVGSDLRSRRKMLWQEETPKFDLRYTSINRPAAMRGYASLDYCPGAQHTGGAVRTLTNRHRGAGIRVIARWPARQVRQR
jgi:hypothetical protein